MCSDKYDNDMFKLENKIDLRNKQGVKLRFLKIHMDLKYLTPLLFYYFDKRKLGYQDHEHSLLILWKPIRSLGISKHPHHFRQI